MITILNSKQKQIQTIFKEQKIIKNIQYIKSPYLIEIQDFGDHIIENILTGEIIAISIPLSTQDDEYLIKHWYKIPLNFNIYDLFKNNIQLKLSESLNNLNNYNLLENFNRIIFFTTLGCNADCYYCYEKNVRNNKIKMSYSVADKVIQKIENRNEKFFFHWFGGEPLYNEEIINYICQQCNNKNINFKSSMISNGILFNETNILKAKRDWHLSSVQITIDGTEKEYEKIKNVPQGSFNQLIQNIHLLLDNDIMVVIRLNVSINNYNNLKKVIKILFEHFKTYSPEKIKIRAHEIFGLEKEKNIYKYLYQLELYIESLFKNMQWETTVWKSHTCMVDTGKAITVLPNGNIGICEHDINKNIITNLDKDFYDIDIINTYAQQHDDKKCQKCTVRPGCIFSLGCDAHGGNNCSEQRVQYIIKKKKKYLAKIAKKKRKRRKHLMITKELYTNLDIYNKATALVEAFNTKDGSDLNYPVKVNFYLQKNLNAFLKAAQEIEQKRMEIIQKYGKPTEEDPNNYKIDDDKIEEATKEIQDFLELEQEIPVSMLKLDWFDKIDMTAAQVAAISFMIEEEE